MKADGSGFYQITLIQGRYDFVVTGSGRCQHPFTRSIDLNSNVEGFHLDVTLERDAFGYTCIERSVGQFQAIAPITLDGQTIAPIVLPFEFPIYSTRSRTAYVSPKGWIGFDEGSLIEGPVGPVLKVFADQGLQFDSASRLLMTPTSSTDMVIEWRDLIVGGERMSFAVELHASGVVDFQYPTGSSDRTTGSNATIGIFDSCANRSFVYSKDLPRATRTGLGIYFAKRFPTIGSSGC